MLVVVELRPLAEVLGVLQGEWMEVEDLAEPFDVIGARRGEVEPEELVLGQELPQVLRIDCAEARNDVALGLLVHRPGS